MAIAQKMIKVILPAYNEEKALPLLLKRLNASFLESNLNGEIIVVNDGSTDKTAESIKIYEGAVPVRLINQIPNKGLAEAVKTGFLSVIPACREEDIIVIMDADNTHPPDLISRMAEFISGGYDVVIASRYQKGAKVVGLTLFRKALSLGASVLFRSTIRIKGVRDYTCGFRAYKVSLLKTAMEYYKQDFIKQRGFACMAEILLRLKRFNPAMQEVPLILRYDYKEGASKIRVGKTIKETFKMLFNYLVKKTY